MNTVIRIFKVIFIICACIIGLPILLYTAGYIYRDVTKFNDKRIIQKQEFISLHNQILQLDSLKNIAILPDISYVVINKHVINNRKRTFGNEPDLGFYGEYYEEAGKNKFGSLDSLLKNSGIDSITAFGIFDKMKKLDIVDISKTDKVIYYRKTVSAMWGERGIIYSPSQLTSKNPRETIEFVKDKFYYFDKD